MKFEFATATRIIFGPGSLAEVGLIATSFGKHALVVIGSAPERAAPALDILHQHSVATTLFSVLGEPTVDTVRQATANAQTASCDLVIGLGGGSAIDTAKAVAAMLGNGGDPLDYLDVIGRGQPLTRLSVPFIAIPTTAGTGSEVTRNAVLASPEHQVKASLRSTHLLARVAIIDSDLLASLPPSAIASSGLDAFTQLVEPFVSVRANPMTDCLCREGLLRSARSLQRAYTGQRSASILEDLALASLFGGLALANAGLGAVHGLAAPIGGQFNAPHGAVCAALLPAVMQANVHALAKREPASSSLERYREIATLVTGLPGADPLAGVAWMRAQCQAFSIPGLAHWGVTPADVEMLVAKARAASSMRGNPLPLLQEELTQILMQSL